MIATRPNFEKDKFYHLIECQPIANIIQAYKHNHTHNTTKKQRIHEQNEQKSKETTKQKKKTKKKTFSTSLANLSKQSLASFLSSSVIEFL